MSIIPNAPELLTEEQRLRLVAQKENQARIDRERSIVRGLIRYLKKNGLHVTHVNDGEEEQRIAGEAQALEAIFSVDESRVYFQRANETRGYGVQVIAGNDTDILSDWSDMNGFGDLVSAYLQTKGIL